MLTVWSICWGDKYPDYFVQRLQKSVQENLQLPHKFVCITDRQINDVETMPFPDDFPGWWAKVSLFRWDTMADRNLWLDLDVVITGDITKMVERYSKSTLATPLNWAASGHGGCQSSVMLWAKNYNVRQVYDLYDHTDPRLGNWPPTTENNAVWGDQEWITELRNAGRIQVVPIESGVYSYKYHVRGNGLPDDARIVVFHGDPKPDQVKGETWFQW